MYTEILKHKAVVGALAVVGVILVGSIAYYAIEAKGPSASSDTAVATSTDDVRAAGTVTPVQNPDLAFAAGGRVTYVNAQVGEKVGQGTLLASLDVGVLSANLDAARASYEGLLAGPRDVDLAGKQTALTQAKSTLSNTYTALPAVLADALAKSEDAVHSTDTLFGSMNTVDYPRVKFLTRADDAADKAGRDRGEINDDSDVWNSDIAALSDASSPEELEAALSSMNTHLALVRDYFTNLSEAVGSAEQGELTTAQVSAVSAARTSVNAIIISLQSEVQAISTDKLAVSSAEDALNLTSAGAASQDIQAAKARVDAAAATLEQSEVIAPFRGTVAAVAVKEGDVVAPNTVAVSILPDSNFEVELYVSEVDAAKVAAGDKADVTLDAYGTGRVFGATVASVDRAASIHNGTAGYKITLVFDAADPALISGQGANAVIHPAATN